MKSLNIFPLTHQYSQTIMFADGQWGEVKISFTLSTKPVFDEDKFIREFSDDEYKAKEALGSLVFESISDTLRGDTIDNVMHAIPKMHQMAMSSIPGKIGSENLKCVGFILLGINKVTK